MKRYSILLLMACLFLVCVSCHREETTSTGVYGTVTKRVGNWMPMVGGHDPSAQEYPIECEVAIFDSINIHDLQDLYPDRIAISDVNIHEVARTSTTGDGHFKIMVPAGKYSIAVVDGDSLIMRSLRSFEGNGWMEKVIVVDGEMTKHDVLVDYAAY